MLADTKSTKQRHRRESVVSRHSVALVFEFRRLTAGYVKLDDHEDFSMTDRSNGYEGVAVEFLAGRGSARSKGIGVTRVREWARTFPRSAAVIDLGCGPGFPITEVLVAEGLNVYAIDASPSFVESFR